MWAELFVEMKRRQDDKRVDDGAIGVRRDRLTTALADVDEQRKDLARMWVAKQPIDQHRVELRWQHAPRRQGRGPRASRRAPAAASDPTASRRVSWMCGFAARMIDPPVAATR